MDSGVAGIGVDGPAKLKEGDLNRPRYFHHKRFLENNCVRCCTYFLLAVKDEFGVKWQRMVFYMNEKFCSTNTTVMSNFGKFQGSFDLLRHLSDFLAMRN